MKIVIRAGGNGTRLWPMSRIKNPKQFQAIIGDKSMIRATFERVKQAVKDPADIFVSINQRFRDRAQAELPELPPANFIVETDARNTGPAMCLEVCYLARHCAEDEIIASLPSDDYISDAGAFRDLLKTTESFIRKNPEYILTPAIRPYYIDTGYSYFKAGNRLQLDGEEAIYGITHIVEKPNYEYCEELVNSGVYYCHTGMYLWRLGRIKELFKKHQPAMYETCGEVVSLMSEGKAAPAQELYGKLEKLTIESAITEKCRRIAMSVSNRIGWSDLGKWHVIKKILKPDENENLTKGQVYLSETANSLVYSTLKKKIIAVNGLKDIVIVDTADALFVSSLKDSAEAKKFVKLLEEEGMEDYL